MGNKITQVILLILIFTVAGCDNGQLFDSTGDILQEIRQIGAIRKISAYDNVNVIFSAKPEHGTVIVSAGNNLIKNITTDILDGELFIRNNNKANWARDLDPAINVYIPYPDISEMFFETVGYVSCDTILPYKELAVTIEYGNGVISLELDCGKLSINNTNKGCTDIVVKGSCDELFITHNSYAPVDCSALKAKKVDVREHGIQNCFVSVSDLLIVSIEDYGNVYYTGNPEVKSSVTGAGKLIAQ